MNEPVVTTCAVCNRALYATDADAEGRCCFCQAPGGVVRKATPLERVPIPEVVVPLPAKAAEPAPEAKP